MVFLFRPAGSPSNSVLYLMLTACVPYVGKSLVGVRLLVQCCVRASAVYAVLRNSKRFARFNFRRSRDGSSYDSSIAHKWLLKEAFTVGVGKISNHPPETASSRARTASCRMAAAVG